MKRLSALFWIFALLPLAADSKEFVMMIRESQKYLARAQPLPAEAGLKEWELHRKFPSQIPHRKFPGNMKEIH